MRADSAPSLALEAEAGDSSLDWRGHGLEFASFVPPEDLPAAAQGPA